MHNDYMKVASDILNQKSNKSVRFASIREALKGAPRDLKRKILFAAGELLQGTRHEPNQQGESFFWTFIERDGRTSFAKEKTK